MNVTDPGHAYELDNQEQPGSTQPLQFIKKERDPETGELRLVYLGTSNEEVLNVLLDRLHHLDGVMPCAENKEAIDCLVGARAALLSRTQRRTDAGVEGTAELADGDSDPDDAEEEEEQAEPSGPAVDLARLAYDTYCDYAGWKSWDGKPIPQWNDLDPATDVQEKWTVAVRAVMAELAETQASDLDTDPDNPVQESRSFRLQLDHVLQQVKTPRTGRHSRERSLAVTKIQEAVMWLGMDLKAQREEGGDAGPNPYPDSYDPASSAPVSPTADGLKM